MTSLSEAPGSRAGFTLIELLIVMVILALSTALVSVGWQHTANAAQDRKAANIIAAALNQTRNNAIRLNRSQTFDLNAIGTDPRLASIPLRSTPRRIRFEPDGSAVDARIIVGETGSRYRIEVDWLTGAIEVESL